MAGADVAAFLLWQVQRLRQIEMEPYICPKLTEGVFAALTEEEEYVRREEMRSRWRRGK